MIIYICVLLCSASLAAAMTPVVIKAANRLKLLDVPNARKVHNKAVPRVGGIAVFLSTVIVIITVLLWKKDVLDSIADAKGVFIAIAAASLFVFLIGLLDDIYDIRAAVKFGALLLAVLGLHIAGLRVEYITFPGSFTLPLGPFSFIFAALWITVITTGINFIDGLDGLACGISTITCFVIAILAVTKGQLFMAMLMFSVCGGLCGFLFYNFNPAKIFLGDCGSMFLGFTIGASSLACAMKSETVVALALPVLALGLPIFDVFFTMIRRFLSRRRIFSSDYGHIHHKLLAIGLKHRHVVIIMYVITATAAGLGFFMLSCRNSTRALAIFFCILLLLWLVFRLLGIARIGDILLRMTANSSKSHRLKKVQDIFEDAQLKIRTTRTLSQWWLNMCDFAEQMDFSRLRININAADCDGKSFIWADGEPYRQSSDYFRFSVSFTPFSFDSKLTFDAELLLQMSMEEAGSRMKFFGRLIDEYRCSSLFVNLNRENISSFMKSEKQERDTLQAEIITLGNNSKKSLQVIEEAAI